MASTDVSGPPVDRSSSLINNPRFRGLFYQVALILVVGWIGYDIYSNALDNLRRLNLVPGDGFLDRTAGFGIIQSLIDYSEASSYRQALWVGLINTLLVAALGIVLANVVVPQAMRVIIPPLTNQFLNLTKNSSLAVAIAYPDLVSVGGTVLNQTGRAVEIVGVWMAVYLGLSVLTSIIMNAFNRRVALVARLGRLG